MDEINGQKILKHISSTAHFSADDDHGAGHGNGDLFLHEQSSNGRLILLRLPHSSAVRLFRWRSIHGMARKSTPSKIDGWMGGQQEKSSLFRASMKSTAAEAQHSAGASNVKRVQSIRAS